MTSAVCTGQKVSLLETLDAWCRSGRRRLCTEGQKAAAGEAGGRTVDGGRLPSEVRARLMTAGRAHL